MAEEWLTVHQAADVSGYHYNYIRQMIRAGKLEARKFGPVWQVSRTALLPYIDEAKDSGDLRRGPKAQNELLAPSWLGNTGRFVQMS